MFTSPRWLRTKDCSSWRRDFVSERFQYLSAVRTNRGTSLSFARIRRPGCEHSPSPNRAESLFGVARRVRRIMRPFGPIDARRGEVVNVIELLIAERVRPEQRGQQLRRRAVRTGDAGRRLPGTRRREGRPLRSVPGAAWAHPWPTRDGGAPGGSRPRIATADAASAVG